MSSTRTRFGASDFLPIAAVIAAGLAIAVTAFLTVRDAYRATDSDQFQREAAAATAAFKSSMERHVNSLAAIHAFVSSSHDVSRWEFSNFAHQILPQNSGFKAVLWLPRVAQAQRKSFEDALQNDGLYGLRLRELTADGALIAADARPEYVPVAYVEPFEGSGSLIGVDLAHNPIYAPLFQTARETGKVVASAPLARTLIDGVRAPSLLVIFPLNRQSPEQKASAQKRSTPDTLEGYALGVLQLDRVIGDVMGTRVPLQAAIAYGPRAAPKLYAPDETGLHVQREELASWYGRSEFHQLAPFAVAGRPFYLALRSSQGGDVLTRLVVPAGTALLVLALTALLTQSMFSTTMRKRQVERAVIARTAELSNINRALGAEIDQRRQAEAALRIAKDKAEAANRAKSAFLSTMSHELRTPLNAIIGFSSMLLEHQATSEEKSRDYLREVNGSGGRLLDLINDILEITQMDTEAGGTDELVYLPDIAGAVIEKTRPQADRAGVLLHNHVSDALPALRGDSRRLQKALTNLVSNSIKFTQKGGEATICASIGAEGLVIEVSDNGMGMPPGEEAKVVDLFSQADNSLSRRHDGVGLGLTFVRRVADLHEAVLHISSVPGEGTRIGMTIPAHRIAKAREVA